MSELRSDLAACADAPLDQPLIGSFVDRATDALESLRELTRGIYPTMLTRSGFGPALTSYASRLQRPGALRLDPAVATSRYAERVEAAAYFCVIEALGHTGADGPTVDVRLDERHAGGLCTRSRPRRDRPARGDRPGGGLRRLDRPGPAARALGPAGQAAGAARRGQCAATADCHTCSSRSGLNRRLRDVRRCAAAGLVELVLVVRREQDDDRARLEGADDARGLDPAHAGQVDVHQDEVGLHHPNRLDGLLAGGDRADARRSRRWPPRRRPWHGGTGPGRRRPGPSPRAQRALPCLHDDRQTGPAPGG